MRTYSVTEAAIVDLESHLNKLEVLGSHVCQVLDGQSARKTHVLVVSFVDASDIAPAAASAEPIAASVPPVAPKKPRTKKAKV